MSPGLFKKDYILWLLTVAAALTVSLLLSCAAEKAAEKPAMLFKMKNDAAVTTTSAGQQIVSYPLTIVHPGDPEERPFGLELKQYTDPEGNPIHYTLWVDSVICRDKVCEVVQVNLKWDSRGNYLSYEVEKGEDLTKLDHIPFSKKDHAKLQRILQDRESPLREVTKEGLVGEKTKKKVAVDGVAGATVLTLSSTVVIGAGYTCYDLWHWANGEVAQIIRKKSGKAFSSDKLKEMLKSKDADTIDFALTSLRTRKIFEPAIVTAVINSMKESDDEVIKSALEYLRAASGSSSAYFDGIVRIFSECSSNKRVFILTALSSEKEEPGVEFYNSLSEVIPDLQTYHEVHLLLTLLENKAVWNSIIEKNTSTLLDHKKFFFSRRAYWFLKKQKLSDSAQKKVDEFFKKNELRLL